MPEITKTVAIIQARMGSTRLPGKVLADVCGQTMLSRVVDRVNKANGVDGVVVAVPDTLIDRHVVHFCDQQEISVVVGPEHDVLSRYVKAADHTAARRIVRITADCPLIDPEVIDETISVLDHNPNYDYGCNFWPTRHFPRGLDIEVLTIETLRRIDRMVTAARHREHVTLGIYEQPDLFQIGFKGAASNHSHLRWTVDTAEDLDLVNQIYRHFEGREFRWLDVIEAYDRFPHWLSINQHIVQKAA